MRFAPVEHADVARLFRLKLEQYSPQPTSPAGIAVGHARRPGVQPP
jgi:hypothetical protein